MNNEQKTPTSIEVIETELNVVLEEYKTLRAEILANIDASRQVLNLTLTGIGAFLVISPRFIESRLSILFLVVPFVFYAMAWAQLRYVLLTQVISNYLRETVEPQVRKNLAEISSTAGRDFSAVLGWSNRGGGLMQHRNSIFLIPIAGANYGIPLMAAVFSIAAYFVILFRGSWTMSALDWVLLAINGCALVYSIVWGFRVELKS
jgi:hypothetical protein